MCQVLCWAPVKQHLMRGLKSSSVYGKTDVQTTKGEQKNSFHRGSGKGHGAGKEHSNLPGRSSSSVLVSHGLDSAGPAGCLSHFKEHHQYQLLAFSEGSLYLCAPAHCMLSAPLQGHSINSMIEMKIPQFTGLGGINTSTQLHSGT